MTLTDDIGVLLEGVKASLNPALTDSIPDNKTFITSPVSETLPVTVISDGTGRLIFFNLIVGETYQLIIEDPR